MRGLIAILALLLNAAMIQSAEAQVVDVRTRPGVTQRILTIAPAEPKAAVILFAGGDGGLQITPQGTMRALNGNFLIKTRQMYVDRNLYVAIVDAPSDHQKTPFLAGFRQTAEHVEDIKAVIAYVRSQARGPVWLIGTSRGTQSVGYIATQLTGPEGPDGIVLTSTILTEKSGRSVPQMDLKQIKVPTLAVHHQLDGCKFCSFSDISALMSGLSNSRRKELITETGGETRGDPCEAMAYHGYNGIQEKVVDDITRWILSN